MVEHKLATTEQSVTTSCVKSSVYPLPGNKTSPLSNISSGLLQAASIDRCESERCKNPEGSLVCVRPAIPITGEKKTAVAYENGPSGKNSEGLGSLSHGG